MSNTLGQGSSAGGSLVQLLAIGQMDQVLTANATRTFFRSSYQKHSIFALESINQPFSTAVSFGNEAQITLNRQGDLLYWMYLRVILPGLSISTVSDGNSNYASTQQPQNYPSIETDPITQANVKAVLPFVQDGYTDASINGKQAALAQGRNDWEEAKYEMTELPVDMQRFDTSLPSFDYAYWTECVGFALIKRAEFKVGGATIDTLYSDLLFAMEELMGKAGRRLTETIGRTMRNPEELMKAARGEQILYIPLPYYFTKAPSLAFPLVSTSYHNVQVWVHFNPLSSLIIKSRQNLIVNNTHRDRPIQDDDLQASLECTYVHLDAAERDALTSSNSTQLIICHQAHTQSIDKAEVTANLRFNFPIINLMFFVRRKAAKEANDHFNYSGVLGYDPLIRAGLKFNNTPRVTTKPAVWWRAVQALQHHSSVPTTNLYSYSWALTPEDYLSPSGSVNFSRLDSVELDLELQSDFGSSSSGQAADLYVFARSYNLLAFSNGLAGLRYSS